MQQALQGLEPKSIWEHFDRIAAIPRASTKEAVIRQYVLDEAARLGLKATQDAVGNVVVSKPAHPGRESATPALLQSHLDMVCEKNEDTPFNFDTDGIRIVRDGDWLKADGTTLGSDNGVGVAAAMAVMVSTAIKHGPLEFVFTIDEETGLTGASEFPGGVLKSKYFLNLDGEEKGTLCIGCAGGILTKARCRVAMQVPVAKAAWRIKVSGLRGGHSGVDIHLGRGNAVRILGATLQAVIDELPAELGDMKGGSAQNAIPRESVAVIALDQNRESQLRRVMARCENEQRLDMGAFDPELTITLEKAELPQKVMAERDARRVVDLLASLHHGVLAMSPDVPGLVQNSTNLATLSLSGGLAEIVTSQRSAIESSKQLAASLVATSCRLAGFETEHSGSYPGWKPEPGSEIVRKLQEINKKLYGEPAKLVIMHAGLGCFATAQIGPPWGTNWIYADNYLQDSAGYETGFDVLAGAVVAAQQFFELMSYCEPDWITPLNYKKALLYVNPGVAAAPSLKGAPAIHPTPAVAYTSGSYLSVNGTLPSAGGVALNPIFTETMVGTSDPGSGTYSIQLQNASGQTLYTRYFTPIQGAIDPTLGNTTDAVFTDPMFSEFIPATAGTTAIVITDPTGATLASLPITGTPPTVTITSPGAGFAGTGAQTLSWNIQSTASATFTSRIYYSVDGGTTWEQLDETSAMTDVLDLDTLPGASAAVIRVDVSDGTNTGSATSSPFSVPRKAPSTIVINSPVTGAVQQAANPVYLTGGAYDTDDGVLKGTALQWSDSAQGSLGSGSPLTVTLKPGSHTIILTATDSDGNTLTATTQITLGGGAPVVTLNPNQNSTCFSAAINATPGAQGADLTAVKYSLDGGASYTAIPLPSLPFTLQLNGTGTINVVAVAVDASGQVSAKSSNVNLGAGCTAATVKANGGSNQSTLVSSAFATSLTTLVVDLNGNPVSGVTVTYAAPATGASATLSGATATTNASGIATVTATANSTAGTYNVTATATNGTSTATFALTNSDFQIASATSTLSVPRGSSNPDTITLTALGGFNGTVTFGCSGLPAGATCTFEPATVTPTAATASTTMTIAASQIALLRWPADGSSVLVCAIVALFFRRRKILHQHRDCRRVRDWIDWRRQL